MPYLNGVAPLTPLKIKLLLIILSKGGDLKRIRESKATKKATLTDGFSL
jgi:hypothetical protein